MKDFRVMYEVKAAGQKKIAKMGENIQTEEDARKAMEIKHGDHIEIIMIADINEEI